VLLPQLIKRLCRQQPERLRRQASYAAVDESAVLHPGVCVGQAKSGTASLCGLLGGSYRVAHEPERANVLRVIRCAAAGFPPVSDEPLEGFDRVYVSDPFGNRIELLEPRHDGPQRQASCR
jgi:hypothetical protein